MGRRIKKRLGILKQDRVDRIDLRRAARSPHDARGPDAGCRTPGGPDRNHPDRFVPEGHATLGHLGRCHGHGVDDRIAPSPPAIRPGKLFLVAAICVVYYLLGIEAFIQRGVFLAMAPVICTVAGSGIIEISAELTSERWERRRLRQKLSVYVSEPVAAEILRRGDKYQQGLMGEKRDAAVLFSDIRNFTTISEHSGPGRFGQAAQRVFQPHGGDHQGQ